MWTRSNSALRSSSVRTRVRWIASALSNAYVSSLAVASRYT
jgi:hypothetical protein